MKLWADWHEPHTKLSRVRLPTNPAQNKPGRQNVLLLPANELAQQIDREIQQRLDVEKIPTWPQADDA